MIPSPRAFPSNFAYLSVRCVHRCKELLKLWHLIPPEIKRSTWHPGCGQHLSQHRPPLRPRRATSESSEQDTRLFRTPLRWYMPRWDRYGDFLHDHFTWLASATVYIAIVLTVIQVGLAIQSLANNNAFHSTSYGLTGISILGPLIAASLIMLQFCCIFIYNWAKVFNCKKRRYFALHLT